MTWYFLQMSDYLVQMLNYWELRFPEKLIQFVVCYLALFPESQIEIEFQSKTLLSYFLVPEEDANLDMLTLQN